MYLTTTEGMGELTAIQLMQQMIMAKSSKQSGTGITVTFDRPPGTMDAKMQQSSRDIIKAALSAAGLSGDWRLNSLTRNRNLRHNTPTFAARSIASVRGGKKQGIKIVVKSARDRRSCFEGILIPPDSVTAVGALQQLSGSPGNGKSGGVTIPVATAKVGEIYLGRVASMTRRDALVVIFPDNPPKMREASCDVFEIAHDFTAKPEDVLRRGQAIRVICTGFKDDGTPTVSRKQLLPLKDNFVAKPTAGVLSLNAFTVSDERVAFVLNLFRTSVEANSTKSAWAKAEEEGTVGGVFLDGPNDAYAPACTVLDDIKEGIQRQWKARDITQLGGIIRYLAGHCYIWLSLDLNKENSVGYAMTEDGYEFLGLTPPPLPEYYEPPTIRSTRLTSTSKTPLPTQEPTPEFLANFQATKAVVAEQLVTTMSEQTAESPPVDLAHIDGVLDSIEEYEAKQRRLDEINGELKEYDDLVAERQQVSEWLEQNLDVLAKVKLAEQLHKRLASRFGKS